MNIKKFGAEAAIAGALAFTALGMGAGVATAAPDVAWKLDRGHGHGGDWDNWDGGGDWNGGWNGGPAWYAPPAAPCGVGYWVPPAVSQWIPPAVWGC
jgi:hypothetical protein